MFNHVVSCSCLIPDHKTGFGATARWIKSDPDINTPGSDVFFLLWRSGYLREQSPLSVLQPWDFEKGTEGAPSCRGLRHYRCRSVLTVQSGRLKHEGFTGRQSSLSHRESQTLNCLLWKLDFYPLRLGSGFPCSTVALLEKHEPGGAHTSQLVVIPLTFDLQGPAVTLNQHRGGCPPGFCLETPTAGVIRFDKDPPPSNWCQEQMRNTTVEDKEVPVFTETRTWLIPTPLIPHMHSTLLYHPCCTSDLTLKHCPAGICCDELNLWQANKINCES